MLCDPHMCGGILYSDRTVRTGHVVNVVFHIWVVGYNIVTTGHVVSFVSSVYGLWDLKWR